MKYNKEILEDLKKLGHNIRKYREQKNTSINELSMLTGIRTNYLRKIENGTAYGVLLNTHIVKIANALEITLYKILSINKKLLFKNVFTTFIIVRFRNKFGMTVIFVIKQNRHRHPEFMS